MRLAIEHDHALEQRRRHVDQGQRMGMIKFGSRVDVLMRPEVKLAVKVGDHVKGASSILAYAPVAQDAAPTKLQPTVAGAN